MQWQQLHVVIPSDTVEHFEEELETLGALSITLADAKDEPIFEPDINQTPLWSLTKLTALFEEDIDARKIAAQLAAAHPKLSLNCKTEILADQDWERNWLKYFKPMQFGKRLWIIPSGYEIPEPTATNIFLDPGLAFGTGTHATTALCLTWLAENDIQGKCVIDYGCGSGILAIAALKLGAKEVWAIDYDPQALIATKENAKRNNIDSKILHCGENADLPPEYQADLLIANILAKPLITLTETLNQHLLPSGHLVLSGILAEQADDVKSAYKNHFDTLTVTQKDDWVSISGQKNPISIRNESPC